MNNSGLNLSVLAALAFNSTISHPKMIDVSENDKFKNN
jgi:hypothetical protein